MLLSSRLASKHLRGYSLHVPVQYAFLCAFHAPYVGRPALPQARRLTPQPFDMPVRDVIMPVMTIDIVQTTGTHGANVIVAYTTTLRRRRAVKDVSAALGPKLVGGQLA